MNIYGQTKGTELEKTIAQLAQGEAIGGSMYYALAKIAKDCGSAATCMASIMALIVNLVIFVPKVWPLVMG